MSLSAMHSVWIWMTQATTTLASALRHWMNTTTSNIINSVPVGDQFNNDLVISVIYIGGVHWFQRSPQLKLDSMCFIALSRFFANRYKKLFSLANGDVGFVLEKHGKHLLTRWWRCEWSTHARHFQSVSKTKTKKTFQENQIENGHDNRFRKFA